MLFKTSMGSGFVWCTKWHTNTPVIRSPFSANDILSISNVFQPCWEDMGGYRHHVHVGGCAFRIFLLFFLNIVVTSFFLHCVAFPMLVDTSSTGPIYAFPKWQALHVKTSAQLFDTKGGLVHFRGEENSFASHLHCISIWACISTHSQSSASFVTTCSSTLMFIHPSASETYNQKTDLCTISTFKQVETGNKTLVRQKQVRDWNRDYGETQDKSWTKEVK